MTSAGDVIPLLHTLSGRQRILVALSWDVRAKKATLMDKLKGTNQQHDLDLSCFGFDKSANYVSFVGAMAQDAMDESGSIYHSGDDATGEGDGDDEAISCELAGLPPAIHSLIFVAEIRSNNSFSEIDAPRYRIADGMTNNNLYEAVIANGQEAGDRKACVLARIFKDPTSPTRWSLHVINDYPKLEDVPSWGDYLTRYL